MPADQRFHRVDAARVDVELGLVQAGRTAAVQGHAQAGVELQALHGLLGQHALYSWRCRGPGPWRGTSRIRMLEQRRGVQPSSGYKAMPMLVVSVTARPSR